MGASFFLATEIRRELRSVTMATKPGASPTTSFSAPQHGDGSGFYGDLVTGSVEAFGRGVHRTICIQNSGPFFTPLLFRQLERQRLIVSIEDEVKRVIGDALSARVRLVARFSIEKNTQCLGEPRRPLFLSHLPALGREPINVGYFLAIDRATLKPAAPVKSRVLAAQLDEIAREFQQILIGGIHARSH